MKYQNQIEEEITKLCGDLVHQLETELIEDTLSAEPRCFYYKMEGDYYRYMAEFAKGDDYKEAVEGASKAYKKAMKAGDELQVTNPVRLGLALNYSVFHYEILNSQDTALKMA